VGIAAELSSLRRARPAASGQVARASVLLAVLTAVFEVGYLLDSSPVRDHSGNGAPPVQGAVGILLCAGTFAVLSVLTIRARRAIASQRRASVAG
jgi:hypothetical protein